MTASDPARRERGIIFSAPMVRALLAGTKMQTRRVIKLYPSASDEQFIVYPPEQLIELEAGEFNRGICHYLSTDALSGPWDLPCAVGWRLWVKEALGRRPSSFLGIEATNGVENAFYKADDKDVLNEHEFNICPWWRGLTLSPIHVPRWASRLTLTVTDVRVQRLQDISEADAEAEGCEHEFWDMALACRDYSSSDAWFQMWGEGCGGTYVDHNNIWRQSYRTLWNSLNGPDAWAANPWVVALTFTVAHRNIDAEVSP